MLTSESNTALEAKRAQLQMELARIDFELARRSSEWSRQMQQDKRLWLMERPADERRLTTAELEPTLLAIGDKHVPTKSAVSGFCQRVMTTR